MTDFVTAAAANQLPDATPADWAGAFLAITSGASVLLERQPGTNRPERHLVTIRGVGCQVIYVPDIAKIVALYANGRRTAHHAGRYRVPARMRREREG